ncbi:30-kDa cleavage and polyadenylation specificity factor 30-like protein [Drosera capensis]
MEDGDGVLSFDFEGTLDTTIPNPNSNPNPIASIPNPPSTTAQPPPSNAGAGDVGGGGQGQRRSFRPTVCRHWLRSLCMKGDACGFLHQYDKARMPICRFFVMYGECREQDCVYKHTNEWIKECNMYKLGFCPNGPNCRYRHAKLPGPPPPVEEVLQKIQQLTSYNYGGSNRFYQQRGQN